MRAPKTGFYAGFLSRIDFLCVIFVSDVPKGVKRIGLTESFCQFCMLVSLARIFQCVNFFYTPCIVKQGANFGQYFIFTC